jgi:hypothetical protein
MNMTDIFGLILYLTLPASHGLLNKKTPPERPD